MPAIEVGRICVKNYGREANKKCIIVDIIDRSFTLITGPKTLNGVKRRRVNIRHIEPTEEIIEIIRGASDDEVLAALEKSGKTSLMKSSP